VRERLGTLLDWAFWLWALVGLGFGFGISVIGLFTVPASAIATIVLLTNRRLRASAYGLLVGIGIPLLVVAYLNREGPGTVCHAIDGGRGTQCDDLYDPRKWLVAGLVFVLAGLSAQLWANREVLPGSTGPA
jgi:uncharacterized membrane protein YidH (DUF202 family)